MTDGLSHKDRDYAKMALKAAGIDFCISDGDVTLKFDSLVRLVRRVRTTQQTLHQIRHFLKQKFWQVAMVDMVDASDVDFNEEFPLSQEMKDFAMAEAKAEADEMARGASNALASLLGVRVPGPPPPDPSKVN